MSARGKEAQEDMARTVGMQNTKEKRAVVPGRRFTSTRITRLVIQLVFFVFAPQVFSMAFAGARYVFACFGKGDAIELTSFVVLLIGTCVYTVLFGRFFCGYACAFGTLGDVLYETGFALSRVLKIKRRRLSTGLESKLRYVKYVVLALFLVASLLGASSVIGAASPWTAFGRFANLQIASASMFGTALLLLVVVSMVWQERFFCEFVCPLGAIFSLLPQLPFLSFRRDMGACTECGACRRACPVGVYPPGSGAQMGECIGCGRCCDVCPAACVAQTTAARLGARMAAKPDGDKPATADKIDVLRFVRAAVLAVLLLAVFWLVGSVNYLPSLNV